jgi:hypothetical protein
MQDHYVRRIVRIERLLLAIALGIHNQKMDKGIDYFMISQNPDAQATFDDVSRLLKEMQEDMERSDQTGQI